MGLAEWTIRPEDLNACIGQHISSICNNGYTAGDKYDNHCAHFVSHLLGITKGFTCAQHHPPTSGKKYWGVTLRVSELFERCGEVGKWAERPPLIKECFAFIAKGVDIENRIIPPPKRHVGIYFNGSIYHYSNRLRRAVRQTPADFGKHYAHAGGGFEVYYGTYR